MTVTTSDADLPAQTSRLTRSAAADAGLFTIDGGGNLSFLAAPDYEAPGDFDGDNVYEVEVTADDGNAGTTAQLISVTVTPVNDNNPVFTSPSSSQRRREHDGRDDGHHHRCRPAGSDESAYSISGGADAALFTIDGERQPGLPRRAGLRSTDRLRRRQRLRSRSHGR